MLLVCSTLCRERERENKCLKLIYFNQLQMLAGFFFPTNTVNLPSLVSRGNHHLTTSSRQPAPVFNSKSDLSQGFGWGEKY